MMRALLAAGQAMERFEREVCELRRHYGEELALVGDVQRIEAEQFAGRPRTAIAHGERGLRRGTHRGGNRERNSLRAVATPPRVGFRASSAGPGAAAAGQGFDEFDNRTRIGVQVGFEIEFAGAPGGW